MIQIKFTQSKEGIIASLENGATGIITDEMYLAWDKEFFANLSGENLIQALNKRTDFIESKILVQISRQDTKNFYSFVNDFLQKTHCEIEDRLSELQEFAKTATPDEKRQRLLDNLEYLANARACKGISKPFAGNDYTTLLPD